MFNNSQFNQAQFNQSNPAIVIPIRTYSAWAKTSGRIIVWVPTGEINVVSTTSFPNDTPTPDVYLIDYPLFY